MKLHYSQTSCNVRLEGSVVLLPYEITLLSNSNDMDFGDEFVLLPYEITLLSNHYGDNNE